MLLWAALSCSNEWLGMGKCITRGPGSSPGRCPSTCTLLMQTFQCRLSSHCCLLCVESRSLSLVWTLSMDFVDLRILNFCWVRSVWAMTLSLGRGRLCLVVWTHEMSPCASFLYQASLNVLSDEEQSSTGMEKSKRRVAFPSVSNFFATTWHGFCSESGPGLKGWAALPLCTATGIEFLLFHSQKMKVSPCKVTNVTVEVAMTAPRRNWVSPAASGEDQSWLPGGHSQVHEGRCVPALIIGVTALLLCFLGGNQRVSNLVTILKLVWLKWLVGTHTTAMATDTWHIFFGTWNESNFSGA